MIERILLDMDSVLVDLPAGLAREHGRELPFTFGEPAGFEMSTLWGISATEMWAPCGRDFWRNLEPLPWMSELVNELELRFGRDNMCLLTSPTLNDGCVDGKLDWIRKHLPAYRRRYLIGPAKVFCAGSSSCLVDDRVENTEAFIESGGFAFTFPAPWNPHYAAAGNPMPVVREWLGVM